MRGLQMAARVRGCARMRSADEPQPRLTVGDGGKCRTFGSPYGPLFVGDCALFYSIVRIRLPAFMGRVSRTGVILSKGQIGPSSSSAPRDLHPLPSSTAGENDSCQATI